MRIVYIYSDNPLEWNSSEWRCAVPARALNRSGVHIARLLSKNDFIKNTSKVQDACRLADVLMIERSLYGPMLSAIQHWKAQDKVVIADFDDAYHIITQDNVSYPFWKENKAIRIDDNGIETRETIDPPPLTQFKWGLRLVHAATVPSKRLADDWQEYTEMIYLPNYIDLQKYQLANSPPTHEGIVIGWGGSVSHLPSFEKSGVIPALQNVCRARPHVKVMICGNDNRIINALGLAKENIVSRPWVPHSQWPNHLAEYDIGLAPLFGPYDDRRSWIKVLEYMVMKIPWIASESPAYNDLRVYGWLVKNNPGAWERVLLDMVDHIEDYKAEAAREPYLFGIAQNIDENLDEIVSVYTRVINRVFGS
ncbi:MAG: glycosyltransferase [Chloroflexota bacterium]